MMRYEHLLSICSFKAGLFILCGNYAFDATHPKYILFLDKYEFRETQKTRDAAVRLLQLTICEQAYLKIQLCLALHHRL